MEHHQEFIRFLASNNIKTKEDEEDSPSETQKTSTLNEYESLDSFLEADCWPAPIKRQNTQVVESVQAQQSSSSNDYEDLDAFLKADCWPASAKSHNLQTAEAKEILPPCRDELETFEDHLNIRIHNVFSNFSVCCNLDLHSVAANGFNVEYRPEYRKLEMKIRNPNVHALIHASGRVVCSGSTSTESAKKASRRIARILSKMSPEVRFSNFRVLNVLGTCCMPWTIKVEEFAQRYPKQASYEPEIHLSVSFKMASPKATLQIYSTGSVTVTASNVEDVHESIKNLYTLCFEFRKERTPAERRKLIVKRLEAANGRFKAIEKLLTDLSRVEETIKREETIELESRQRHSNPHIQQQKNNTETATKTNKTSFVQSLKVTTNARFRASENWGKIQTSSSKLSRASTFNTTAPATGLQTSSASKESSATKRAVKRPNNKARTEADMELIPKRISSFARRVKPSARRTDFNNITL